MIQAELKQLFRSKWIYIVLTIFVVLFVSIFMLQQLNNSGGFDRFQSSLLNLLLFLLPLFILTVGAMSIAADTESGWYTLLRTYPVTIEQYIATKYIALCFVFLFGLAITEGLLLLLGSFLGISISPLFFLYTLIIIIVMCGISVFLGTLAQNRLHALGISLAVWSFFSLLSSYVVMALGTVIPQNLYEKLIYLQVHLNILDWLRYLYLIDIEQTGMLGKSFYYMSQFYRTPYGTVMRFVFTLCWLLLALTFAYIQLNRREKRT